MTPSLLLPSRPDGDPLSLSSLHPNHSSPQREMELWGGVECTVNRVGDEFFCQFSRSGHIERSSDLDLLADLGLRAIRYPILWEKWAPRSFDEVSWEWADARLHQLRELKIRPIVGLLHHGGGPAYTNLLDESFAPGVARWASMVAQRFPHVEAYTPINEPLTTARFSTLYGFWFPHAHDDRAFARAMVNQCRATVLAMREIRRVNPAAILIQNEDIGVAYASPRMQYQADFENTRRWLSFDLLCGRVVNGHPMHHFLRWYGISDSELDWFRDNPCPPDVIGVDHYVTSNRFLDEHVECYPEEMRGSNGRDAYVDAEAVRVDLPRNASVRDALVETWQRYNVPVALFEAHMGCTREEQMRWLCEVWQQAEQARSEGVPVQAVTAWSLLGAHDWNSILTRVGSHYEPGAFDTRAPSPRPTALSSMLRALGRGENFEHPVLSQPGWWKRPDRILFDSPGVAQAREEMLASTWNRPQVLGQVLEDASQARFEIQSAPQVLDQVLAKSFAPLASTWGRRTARPLLILGGYGTLGRAFSYVCHSRGLLAHPMSRFDCDILDLESVRRALDEHDPWAVVNATGSAEHFDSDAHASVELARECARRGVALVNFSSDQVFDGSLRRAYLETDATRPESALGRAKAAMEEGTLRAHEGALVVRAGSCFGPWDKSNFLVRTLRALERGEEVRVPDNARLSPTYVPFLAHATLDLLLDGTSGLWHGANEGEVSWHEWAVEAAGRAGLSTKKLVPIASAEIGKKPRAQNRALRSERAWIMAPLFEAMDQFERERER